MNFKNYKVPQIEFLLLSPSDVIQVSGNDPFAEEYDEWNSKGELPGLKQ